MCLLRPPPDTAAKSPGSRSAFRIGGRVQGQRNPYRPATLEVKFVLTDFAHQDPVEYTGVFLTFFVKAGIIAMGPMAPTGPSWREVLA